MKYGLETIGDKIVVVDNKGNTVEVVSSNKKYTKSQLKNLLVNRRMK